MNQNELRHYGVKGMRWGVRKRSIVEKRLNSNARKSKEKEDKYETYLKNYNEIDRRMKMKGPVSYGVTRFTGAGKAQTQKLKNLKTSSEKTKKKVDALLSKVSKTHTVKYDITTGQYSIV